jgi:GntR family transcriptional regulator
MARVGAPLFRIDASLVTPIWAQIEDGVRRLLAGGELRPSDPVPSVRELAAVLRVNPATVAKAYQRLVAQDVLEVRRGEGTFVAARPAPLPPTERSRRLSDAARQYQTAALSVSATLEEAVEALEAEWSSFGPAAARRMR